MNLNRLYLIAMTIKIKLKRTIVQLINELLTDGVINNLNDTKQWTRVIQHAVHAMHIYPFKLQQMPKRRFDHNVT